MSKLKNVPSILDSDRLITKALRLLRVDKFPVSSAGLEDYPNENSYVSNYQVPQTEIRNAWLSAEYSKARALLERQRNLQLY